MRTHVVILAAAAAVAAIAAVAAAAVAAAADTAAAAATKTTGFQCEAKLSYVYSTQLRVSSPLQSRSKAVVCASTPRKYPRSGYFLVCLKAFI